MNVSVNGYHTDGTVTSFHLFFDALSAEHKTALKACEEAGTITEALLEELKEHKIHWQMLVEEFYELDVK